MRHRVAILLLSALALIFGRPLSAQTSAAFCPNPPCKLLLAAVPQGIDILPADIVFNFDGEITTDLPASLLQNGITISTGAANPLFRQLVIRSSYTEGIALSSTVGDAYIGALTPWSAPAVEAGANEPLALTWQPGSAALGQTVSGTPGKAYGFLKLHPDYLADSDTFFQSTFTIQAFFEPQANVPEPGALVLSGSLLVAGMAWLRRRR